MLRCPIINVVWISAFSLPVFTFTEHDDGCMVTMAFNVLELTALTKQYRTCCLNLSYSPWVYSLLPQQWVQLDECSCKSFLIPFLFLTNKDNPAFPFLWQSLLHSHVGWFKTGRQWRNCCPPSLPVPLPVILPLPWPYYSLSVYYKTLGKQRDTCSYCPIDRQG